MSPWRRMFFPQTDSKQGTQKIPIKICCSVFANEILSPRSSMKLFMDVVPDFEVDIPLLWQYIGQILGALMGAPSSNMNVLKSLFPLIPKEKCQQLFQDILRYATEFSVSEQKDRNKHTKNFALLVRIPCPRPLAINQLDTERTRSDRYFAFK